jgi:tRNA(Arg) A34 adenosine deaminase TadA
VDKVEQFLRQAIELAYENIARGGRLFGAVVVKDGEAIAAGINNGGRNRRSIYASGHPCPMCMAAMRMADDGETYGHRDFYAEWRDEAACRASGPHDAI